jgi:dolichyl-phosphate beta-glucosyltransferase
MKLSVIIPAFNEQNRLGDTLDQLTAYFQDQSYEYEVIVVDDGSADKTQDVVNNYTGHLSRLRLIANGRNMGKGYSVKHGVSKATGEFVLFYDADASTPINQIEKFWPYFENGNDVCIGSRSMPDSDVQVHQPWFRETMGRVFNLIVQIVAVRGFIDTQCGFKAFRAEAAREVFPRQTLAGFGFDVELLYIAKKHGYKICEVPVTWIDSPDSRVHPIKDAAKMFGELLTIRYRSLKGAYQ